MPPHLLCGETGLKPVYDFLDMLSIVLIVCLQDVLCWLKYREISCSACFPQIFFIHSLLLMEMSVLLLMALGSFVANHNLLQDKSILNT